MDPVAAHLLGTFIHAWGLTVDVNARLLNVLNASLRLLLDAPGGNTLLGAQRLLYDLDYSLVLDEFQYAANTSLTDVLSGSRKYRLALCLAHQSRSQIPELLRQSISANAGSIIAFEVAPEDAQALAPEFTTFDPLMEHSGLQTANRGVFDPATHVRRAPFLGRAIPICAPIRQHSLRP